MVTIGMNYNVLPGKEKTFENAFNKVVKAMMGIEGHGETHMYRDINDQQQYLIVSQWSSKKAFDRFIASDAFKQVAAWGQEEILSGRPKHEVFGGDEAVTSGVCPACED